MLNPGEDRIQPCLFDRLIDENPESKIDSRAERAISLKRYREGVLRDLAWLMNSKAHLLTEDITSYGEVSRSVLNFGIPDLCGQLASGLDLGLIENQIVEAIKAFEPRIIPETITVTAVAGGENSGPNIVAFEIRGDLWANPVPEQLHIKTQIDMETGQCVF
jgi:type VI secretion system protein ImpF